MLTQEQAVASSVVVSAISGYILWSLIETGNFLPYISYATPNMGNILLFVLLLSISAGGVLTVAVLLLRTLYAVIFRKERDIAGTSIATLHLSIFGTAFIMLLLHIFNIIKLPYALLSYGLIWGIVIYGRYRETIKHRKLINRTTSSKPISSTVGVRV